MSVKFYANIYLTKKQNNVYFQQSWITFSLPVMQIYSLYKLRHLTVIQNFDCSVYVSFEKRQSVYSVVYGNGSELISQAC